MDKQIITFSANEQNLVRIGGECHYSSNKVSYIEAHFDLGANWDGFDSVRAVWFTDRVNGISTVLDGEGNCTVPTEVLKKKDRVFVNLVGSIVSNGELTDRLTTYPAVALVVDSKAKVDSTETAPVTPSQFEQFVSIVQDAVANIKDIVSTTLNADYTLTFVYSDGTSYTTPSIRGERGPQGADGADGTDGNGIASAILNSNYTLTLTFTDGTSYTTPSIRGAQGPKGDPGDVSQAQLDAVVSDLKSELNYTVAYEKDFTNEIIYGAYIKTAIDVGNTVDLTPIDNSGNGYIIIPCMAGARFVITGAGGVNSRLWAFVDADNKMLAFAASSINVTGLELVAPSGTAKAIFNVATWTSRSIVQKNVLLPVKSYVDDNFAPINETLLVEKDISDGFESGYIALNVVIGNTVNLTPVSDNTTAHKIVSTSAGTKYRVYGTSGNASRVWGFLDIDNKLLSVGASYTTSKGEIITAPANAVKLVLDQTANSLTTVYQIDAEIGSDIAEKAESASELATENDESLSQFTLTSQQLFNRYAITENKAYSNDGQSIVDDSTKCLSDFIPVEGGAAYKILACVGKLIFFSADKRYITYYSASSYETAQGTTAPATACYLRLEMTKYFYPYAQTMVVKGSSLGKDVRFGSLVNKERVDTERGYRFSDIPIPKEYSAIGTKAVDGTQDFDDDSPSVSDLYDAYDALMTAFPNYITKEDFGMDESGTYHMYAYYFTPEDVPTEYDMYRKPYPKINLRSGIHGNGTQGDSNINLFCLFYLMKSLCYNWRESEALEYLRWNVRFAILPLQNPWGFENKKRFNSNGVDINRNFSVGWQSGTQGNPDYGGASPMSEDETNNIVAFEEANADAIFTVDVHSQGGVPNQNQMSYMSLFSTSDMFYTAKSLVTKVSHVWDSQNIPNLQEMDFHGYVACEFHGWGTSTSYMTAMLNKPAITIEGFKNFNGSSYTDGSAEVVKMVADQLGYGILLGLNHFKN